MHDVAPVTNGGSDEVEISGQDRQNRSLYEAKKQQEERIFAQWACLWRTMVLSSMGKTLYPYCRYIRTLNLNDLEELLKDSRFKPLSLNFFAGELAQFNSQRKVTRGRLLDEIATLNKVGEVVTQQTPMLEELSGHIASGALVRWIPRLPRLRNLNIWHGEALEGTGKLIREHCPSFNTLTLWDFADKDADHGLAAFFNDLRPHSIESFEIFSCSEAGAETFLALNNHSASLADLRLSSIKSEAIRFLHHLKDCTNLVALALAEHGVAATDLENRHNDVFLEVIDWLQSCTSLRTITFTKFLSAPAIMTPILFAHKIHLTKLELEGYAMRDTRAFHQALGHQTSLQSLWLKGESEEPSASDGISILVDSLCKLTSLTDLRLRDISDSFRDEHICAIARSLSKLEEWWTSGWGITDHIWEDISTLRNLRRLELNAMTMFTANGLLDFVLRLGPGNRGFVLAVMMADTESNLSEGEQNMIRETMQERVDGRFEFTLMRGTSLFTSPPLLPLNLI